MTAQSIITDPFLLSVLSSSAHTRQQCLDLLSETSSHPLRTTMSTSPDAPPSPPSASESTVLDLSKQQQALFSQLSKLRGLNRDAVLGVRETKQVTAEARQEVDRLHLQLQNLYYEQRHLSGEIAACESFDHKYLTLPLIPLEDFLTLYPQHATPETTEDEVMIARIKHEHEEREQLEQARQELLKKKQALIAENKKRKEDLAALDADLEKFIEAAEPIQRTFEREY